MKRNSIILGVFICLICVAIGCTKDVKDISSMDYNPLSTKSSNIDNPFDTAGYLHN